MTTETQALTPVARAQVQLSESAQHDVDGFKAMKFAAQLMAKSGCFADIKGGDEETQIAKALVKIAIGRDYGFSAAESMQHIELIQGRPSIAAHARAAKMKAAGYRWRFLQFDEKACDLDIYDQHGEVLGNSPFAIEDARRMGLAEKDNWKKNPRNMLYCRAISNAQRWYAPEVLSAGLISSEEAWDDPQFGTDAPPADKPKSLEIAPPQRKSQAASPTSEPEAPAEEFVLSEADKKAAEAADAKRSRK